MQSSPVRSIASHARTAPDSVKHSPDTGSLKIADFFGWDVFQIVLHNPNTAYQLKRFCQKRLCAENLEFLDRVDQYHNSLDQLTQTVLDIHKNYISVRGPAQVNLDDEVLLQINKNLKALLLNTIPSMESVFLPAQNDIQKLVANDVYPKFVRHQMISNAAKALASDKNKYAGLGDCFVMTDPAKADNPIVYASDGFVKVTGYERNEIVPRNCRFLQSRQTDRASVSRIKRSLDEQVEHVELLLNERKTGEPFWNLLYTAPLRNLNGKVDFFLGGQINISTTIHNTSDILRVLSYDETGEGQTLASTFVPTKSKSSFFSSLRSKPKTVSDQVPGMENNLLQGFDKMTLEDQKMAFYTAYSKYMVIHAESMKITYVSPIMLGSTNPTAPPGEQSQHVVSQDVFKILSQQALGMMRRDYKSKVKTALKAGKSISIDINLQTQDSTSPEAFVSHWTPLKDDFGAVRFIVLVLSPAKDGRDRQL